MIKYDACKHNIDLLATVRLFTTLFVHCQRTTPRPWPFLLSSRWNESIACYSSCFLHNFISFCFCACWHELWRRRFTPDNNTHVLQLHARREQRHMWCPLGCSLQHLHTHTSLSSLFLIKIMRSSTHKISLWIHKWEIMRCTCFRCGIAYFPSTMVWHVVFRNIYSVSLTRRMGNLLIYYSMYGNRVFFGGGNSNSTKKMKMHRMYPITKM